jgi:CBS-domain-containing membrane protein
VQETLLQLQAREVMTRDFRVIDAEMSLRAFADEYILSDWQNAMPYYAASEGRYRGLVTIEDLHTVERSRWETETLESIAHPLMEIASVEEKTPLIEVINRLEAKQLKHITVISPAGAVAGVIDRGDVVRAVTKKLGVFLPEAEIRRIKTEGSYPPTLQLQAIAKATSR